MATIHTQIAENLLTKYVNLFKQNKNFGAYTTMLKNKSKTLKEQVLWLKNYCERKNIDLIF